MRILHRFILFLAIAGMVGCATTDEEDKSKWSAERYYQEAQAALKVKNYETAIQNLEGLEGQYPYGAYAEQARLDLAYVHYLAGESESAIAAADRFIKQYPQHQNVDYAYYLRGLVLFEEGRGFLYDTFKQDPTHRNSEGARRAYNYFAEMVQRFPQSKYSDDARQRMVTLRNRLAAYEVYVAQFYLERDAYLAAANRGKYVVENYDQTPSVGDALVVMVRAYRKLGMTKLADDAQRVLVLNYPQHPELLKLQ